MCGEGVGKELKGFYTVKYDVKKESTYVATITGTTIKK